MKYWGIYFTLVIVFLSINGFAQHELKETVTQLKAAIRKEVKLEAFKKSTQNKLQGFTESERLEVLEKLYVESSSQNNAPFNLYLGLQIANSYSKLGRPDASIDTYFKLHPIAQAEGDVISQAMINTGIGTEYFFLKSYDKALPKFKSAYEINLEFRDSVEVAGSIHNIGTTYSRLGQKDSALYYLNLGLEYFRNLKDSSKMAQTYNNLGSFYHRNLKQTHKSLRYFEKALRLHLITGNDYEAGISYVNLGVIYYELNDMERGFAYLSAAINNAEKLKNIPLLRLSLENISQMYEEQEKFDSAYYYQKELIALNDTLNTSQQKSIISELEDEYRQKQLRQEKEIAELRLNVLNKWIVIAVLAIVILILLSLYFFYKKRTKEELERTKSQFFANLAHEFRTPIGLIKSPAQEMFRKTKDEQTRSRLATIIKSSDQLLGLFNQLLDVSKLQSRKMEVNETFGDVVDYTRSLVEQLKAGAEEKNIRIAFHSDKDSYYGVFDHEIFRKALFNLVSNAIKFSPSDTAVTIDLNIPMSECGNFVQVDVTDQGSGVDTKLQKDLFQRFHYSKSKDNFQGMGLGLALSRELIQLSGGELKLVKTGGNGSVFAFRIPVKQKEHNVIQNAGDIKNKFSILLVDDHPDLLKHLQQELNEEYVCFTARNGQEGFDLAKKVLPDVIISDVIMPEMDGIEMAQSLKDDELTEHIPVLLLTARKSSQTKFRSLETGVVSYMTKPFDIQEIKYLLRSFMGWRARLKEKYSVATINEESKHSGILDHSNSFIQKIISIVEQHLDDDTFSVERLAEELFLSRAQVHRKVKATTGLTTSTLMRNVRLEKAIQMLKNDTELNINEVAYSCGFSAPSYFTKSFSAYFGIKPSEV